MSLGQWDGLPVVRSTMATLSGGGGLTGDQVFLDFVDSITVEPKGS